MRLRLEHDQEVEYTCGDGQEHDAQRPAEQHSQPAFVFRVVDIVPDDLSGLRCGLKCDLRGHPEEVLFLILQ